VLAGRALWEHREPFAHTKLDPTRRATELARELLLCKQRERASRESHDDGGLLLVRSHISLTRREGSAHN
jgi:hypothetical protein